MTGQLGATCKRGHERAIYERRRPRPGGGTPIRNCTECQKGYQRVRQRVHDDRPGDEGHPDARSWRRFCRTVEQRIQAVRVETPRCGECGGPA